MHENMKNNAKEMVIWTYRLMERETLQEIRRKTKKNLLWSLAESEREKSFEKFLKKWFEQVKSDFLKNLIHEFRLIENQFQLIETDRGFFKSFQTISKQFRLI